MLYIKWLRQHKHSTVPRSEQSISRSQKPFYFVCILYVFLMRIQLFDTNDG